jgi:glutamate-1-semialdehyde 2,1-aminomutase
LLSTTHGAEQHGLAAAIAVTEFYQKHPVIQQLALVGAAFRGIVERCASESGVAIGVVSDYDCRPMLKIPNGLEREFCRIMIDRGVLLGPWVCPCYRRTFSELERTEEAIRIFCRTVANRSAA